MSLVNPGCCSGTVLGQIRDKSRRDGSIVQMNGLCQRQNIREFIFKANYTHDYIFFHNLNWKLSFTPFFSAYHLTWARAASLGR